LVPVADAFDIGATIYVGGTLGPAGVWGGGSMLYYAGELAVSGLETVPTALPASAKYAVAVTYGVVVIPVSTMTVNNPEVHELLEEAYEEPWLREIIEQPWWK
jgi:hypothetical protein